MIHSNAVGQRLGVAVAAKLLDRRTICVVRVVADEVNRVRVRDRYLISGEDEFGDECATPDLLVVIEVWNFLDEQVPTASLDAVAFFTQPR
jgi:hypothetical protein